MHLERLPEIERGPSLKCLDCTFVTNDLEDYNLHVVKAHKEGFECPFPDCSVRFLLGDMDDHFAAMHEPSKQENGSFCLQFRDNSAASATTTTVSECASTSYCSDALCSDFEMPTPSRMPVGVFQGSSRDVVQWSGVPLAVRSPDGSKDNKTDLSLAPEVHERRYTQRSRPLKYTCDWPDCARAFASPGLLQDHVNAHRGVRPYQCTNCGCSFSARARFAVHLSKYHRMSIRDYNCASDLLKPPSNDESQI
ncbi:zinc finger, C2H2 type [Necator americanus]|uniref:Zinc finger, C2H2 type n=1 Tax=Necator americanus TaxID=51031 RepID=W2TDM6_NECAM|nr:zinc finger, C2H2 type [Necator americanus]ETN79699.1 zinc finger, C2H2 type [Necator americanus]